MTYVLVKKVAQRSMTFLYFVANIRYNDEKAEFVSFFRMPSFATKRRTRDELSFARCSWDIHIPVAILTFKF